MSRAGATTRIALACGLLAATAEPRAADTAGSKRFLAVQDEMRRLEVELDALSRREQTLLGDVARMDTEIALRRAQLEDVTLKLADTEKQLRDHETVLATLTAERERRAPRLAARIREIYKRGPAGILARTLAPIQAGISLEGIRYASYLTRRDAEQLASWRVLSGQLRTETGALAAEQTRLASLRADASTRSSSLASSRESRSSLLARIRGDREQHERALSELTEAARRLGRVVDSVDAPAASFGLDVRKFRGLLDWPAAGPVTAKFGTVIHPKFKTEVPHPGLDIDAPEGEPFRTVFDGRVAFAAPLAGYGLTAVVDHGNGVVSVYAHAGVLLVSAGQEVTRGQELGRVGDSGSLRGAYLYFELREAGRPVDPSTWFRRR